MNLSPRRRDDPHLDITPLIDVVFLMLIFFMVSTTFLREANLRISLPESSEKPTESAQRPMDLTINRQGNIFVNGHALVNDKTDTVRRALVDAIGDRNPARTELVIRADAHTEHQVVVTALDAAGKAGLVHIGIATVPPGKQ